MFRTDKQYQFSEFQPKQNKNQIIQPNDKISIQMATNEGHILLESQFTGQGNPQMYRNDQYRKDLDYLIEEDSLVKIPTLGRIKLGGKTIREAEDHLEELFSENYQNPYVKIKVTNRKVTIFFEQGKSGQVLTLPEENMTLIEAIAVAGGLSENSKSYEIKLLRGDLGAESTIYKYNISSAKELSNYNFTLEANDIIYVEARPRYVTKFLHEIQPYLMLITTTLLLYTTIVTTSNM